MGELVKKERIDAIMSRLGEKLVLDLSEVADLQATVDLLETKGVLEVSHHESHATEHSYFSQHHTGNMNVFGVLEAFVGAVGGKR